MQVQKRTIKNWAFDDRPREKLLRKSPMALSDSELLAILIHHGTANKSAVDLAKDILKLGKSSLSELGKLSVKELMKIKGIGEAKAITIAAALELGRRRQAAGLLKKAVVPDARRAAGYLQAVLRDHKQEVFAVVFLNQANRVNHIEIISQGGITATVADPRIILKKALEEDAVNIILCHNHPSGNLRPSKLDEELTERLVEAAKYFDIKVLDHIIVSENGYFSFSDRGMM